MNKNLLYIAVFIVVIIFSSGSGCMKMALRMSPELFDNISESIFEECDTELAYRAIPSNLKLLEGILKNDPENKNLLRLLSMGFCGYSMLFVENEDKKRASDLYYRAATYGFNSLGITETPENANQGTLNEINKIMNNKDNIEPLLWTTVSWMSWINLNLHKPSALAQLGIAQSCIDTLIETNPDIFYGMPYILKAVSLSARSPMMGGDYVKAQKYFEKALSSGKREFYLSQYYYARYYCVGLQDKKMFTTLLNEIIDSNSDDLNDICLINKVIQAKALELLNAVDEYFI